MRARGGSRRAGILAAPPAGSSLLPAPHAPPGHALPAPPERAPSSHPRGGRTATSARAPRGTSPGAEPERAPGPGAQE